MLYGHEPRHFGVEGLDSCAVPDLQVWLKERQVMTQLVQQHLHRAQNRMKIMADKNRTERSFFIGDSLPQTSTICSEFCCQETQLQDLFSLLWAIYCH